MKRSMMRPAAFTAMAGVLALVACAPGVRPAAAPPSSGPSGPPGVVAASEIQIHDPTMIQAGGRFYLFGTGNGIAALVSEDKVEWRRLPRVFETAPEWVQEILPGFRNHIWAPDIYEHDGTFYLYYSVSAFGRNTSAIGVATNPTLDPDDARFRWTDHGIVVESVPGRDMWNAIDAHVIHDHEGLPWMSFGSHWGGIKLVRLDPGLTRIAEPQEWRTIAARHRYWKLDERDAGDSANPELDYDTLYPTRILEMNRASLSGAVEAPVIFRRDDFYYLFVSWDRCCRGVESTYKVVVGRSRDIRGPYLDREGQDMNHGGGSLVVHGFERSDRWAAGGHNDVIRVDGTDFLVFHAYDATAEGQPRLLIRPIEWDRWGWPVVTVDEP